MSAEPIDLRAHSVAELLALYTQLLSELTARQVLRSSNNPVADYSEWLTARAFGLALAAKSVAGYDAEAADGTRYQVKGRRPTASNRSRQLSFIRGFDGEAEPFDYLVGILFNEDLTVMRAAQIPVATVRQHATWIAHVNGWRFILRDSVWALPAVVDITEPLQRAALAPVDEPH